ncbi:MAG: translation elongation factor Ts [Deltaproteobacteria bacterium]|nr:translation elongation factor Ts [Deltaproteobacteria bacterium]
MTAISAQAVKKLREKTGAGMMDCKRALGDAGGDAERAFELLRERGQARAAKRAGRETSEGLIALALDGAAAGLVELGCETDFVARTADFQSLAALAAETAAAHPEAQTAEALCQVERGGEKLGPRIQAAIGKLGENIVLKRHARIEAGPQGSAGGYIHAGGKLGAMVALATAASGPAVAGLARDLAMHVAAADPSPIALAKEGIPAEVLQRETAILQRQVEGEGKPAHVAAKIVEGRLRKFYGEVCLLEQPFVKDSKQSVQQFLKESAARIGEPVQIAGFVRYRLGETPAE